MKKLLSFLCGCSLFALFVTGCGSSIRASQYGNSPLNVGVNTKAVDVEIEVGEKINGTAISRSFLIFDIESPDRFADGVTYGVSTPVMSFADILYEQLKSAAAYDAIYKSGADVIIAPRYEIQTDATFLTRTVKVVVTGYKGKIKSIK